MLPSMNDFSSFSHIHNSYIKQTACRKNSIIKYLTVFPSVCLLQGSNLGDFKLLHCFSKLQNLYKFLHLPILLH
jgi:hypothetical protein